MKLVGYKLDGRQLIGVCVSNQIASLDDIDVFYASIPKYLDAARDIIENEVHGVTDAIDQTAGATRSSNIMSTKTNISDITYVPPVPTTSRILCLGLNYLKHAEEQGDELPSTPTIFARYRSTLTGHLTEVPIPSDDDRFDWEGELAVIIGKPLKNATPEEAEAAILGYTCFNDLSARGYQWATSQWTLGKNADRSGPIGPVVVTPGELGDPYKLNIETRVNGITMQSGNTSDMVFRAPETISHISRIMTLLPGDVLSTGTPDGVGFTRRPPIYLKDGDNVEVEIEGIGILSNYIVTGNGHR